MARQSYVGAVQEALNLEQPAYSAQGHNSPNRILVDCGGIYVHKSLTLAGNGAQLNNAFQLTGMVRCIELMAHCSEATDSTTLTLFKFELWDGTNAIPITDTVDASGIVAGGMIYKRGLAAVAAVLINPVTCLVSEAAANKISFEPFFATQKTGGVDTFIRLSYTGDANTDVDVMVSLRYIPHTDASIVEAV